MPRTKKKPTGAPESAKAAEAASGALPNPVLPTNPELGLKGDGVEKPNHPEINRAMKKYVADRDTRVTASGEEVASKKKLMDAMHAYGLKVYQWDDLVCELKPKDETEALRVKHAADYDGTM